MGSLLKYSFDGSALTIEEFNSVYSLVDSHSWNGCFDIPPFPTRKFYAFFEKPIESYCLSLPQQLIVLPPFDNIS